MELHELLNWVLGGGLVATLVALLTLKPTVMKARSEAVRARAEAERAMAAAETVRITNTEQATRILIDNIVEPLKKEFNATRREMARLRKALNQANACEHSDNCPVLHKLRELQDEREPAGNGLDPLDGTRHDDPAPHRSAAADRHPPDGEV